MPGLIFGSVLIGIATIALIIMIIKRIRRK